MKRAIAYFRVSTDRQGKSGLGLEAQHEAVHLFALQQDYQVTAEFTEIESGKKNDRPELMAALLQCKKQKATLIIAKLDRLGRNVAFIANLMESNVEFLAVDNPHANPLMIHLLAAFAEHERKQISRGKLKKGRKTVTTFVCGFSPRNILCSQSSSPSNK